MTNFTKYTQNGKITKKEKNSIIENGDKIVASDKINSLEDNFGSF